MWWHGFAVQDARPLASKGFRPPFGLGRVTFLCVAKAKSPIERPPPLICPTYVGFLRLTRLSDGTRRRAFGFHHPWLRPKPASNIPVLAPNRVERRSPLPDLAHGLAPLARHPVSRPGQAGSPQRIRGGTKTVPAITSGSGRRVQFASLIAPYGNTPCEDEI